MTHVPSGSLPVGAFPIAVQEGDGQVFAAFLLSKSQGGGQIDIALRALDMFSNDVLKGACFQLYGGSEEGCDENNDGRVEFAHPTSIPVAPRAGRPESKCGRSGSRSPGGSPARTSTGLRAAAPGSRRRR